MLIADERRSTPISILSSLCGPPRLTDSSSQHRSVAFQAAAPIRGGISSRVSHPIPPRATARGKELCVDRGSSATRELVVQLAQLSATTAALTGPSPTGIMVNRGADL